MDDPRGVSIVDEADATCCTPVRLTDRELDVLRRVAGGERNRDIAALRISPRTVEVHVSHIRQKLEVASRAGAIGHAVKFGLVALEDISVIQRP